MRHVQKCILPVLMIVVMILMFGTHSAYAAPGIMNYQGTLTDTAGLPVSATKAMTFKIFATISDTTSKWTSVIQSVVVKNGVFSVNLGEQDAFPAGLFDSDSLFLGVTVDGVELTPRKRLASVPYAISAGSGGIPKGGIIMWSGAVAPAGWALCNGQNGTPDLRDRFVLSAGTIYPVGTTPGGTTSHTHAVNSHSHSIATDGDHSHAGTTGPSNHSSDKNTTKDDLDISRPPDDHTHAFTTNPTGVHGHGGATGVSASDTNAQSNLPPYHVLAFIIKL